MQPNVDLFVRHAKVGATGLRDRPGERAGGEFPAEITVEGESLGGGNLKMRLEADPLAARPHFHLSLKLDNVNLPSLNESLRAYANVDVGRGTFRLVGEMAGRDGGFQGNVKPFFEDLDFRTLEDKDKGTGARIWKRIVAGAAWVVKDEARDRSPRAFRLRENSATRNSACSPPSPICFAIALSERSIRPSRARSAPEMFCRAEKAQTETRWQTNRRTTFHL